MWHLVLEGATESKFSDQWYWFRVSSHWRVISTFVVVWNLIGSPLNEYFHTRRIAASEKIPANSQHFEFNRFEVKTSNLACGIG